MRGTALIVVPQWIAIFRVSLWPGFRYHVYICVLCLADNWSKYASGAQTSAMNEARRKRHGVSAKSRSDPDHQQRGGLQNTGAQRPKHFHSNVSWKDISSAVSTDCSQHVNHQHKVQADLFLVYFPPLAHHPKIVYTGTCCPTFWQTRGEARVGCGTKEGLMCCDQNDYCLHGDFIVSTFNF